MRVSELEVGLRVRCSHHTNIAVEGVLSCDGFNWFILHDEPSMSGATPVDGSWPSEDHEYSWAIAGLSDQNYNVANVEPIEPTYCNPWGKSKIEFKFVNDMTQ